MSLALYNNAEQQSHLEKVEELHEELHEELWQNQYAHKELLRLAPMIHCI